MISATGQNQHKVALLPHMTHQLTTILASYSNYSTHSNNTVSLLKLIVT